MLPLIYSSRSNNFYNTHAVLTKLKMRSTCALIVLQVFVYHNRLVRDNVDHVYVIWEHLQIFLRDIPKIYEVCQFRISRLWLITVGLCQKNGWY